MFKFNKLNEEIPIKSNSKLGVFKIEFILGFIFCFFNFRNIALARLNYPIGGI